MFPKIVHEEDEKRTVALGNNTYLICANGEARIGLSFDLAKGMGLLGETMDALCQAWMDYRASQEEIDDQGRLAAEAAFEEKDPKLLLRNYKLGENGSLRYVG
jgi:hypothetical protein